MTSAIYLVSKDKFIQSATTEQMRAMYQRMRWIDKVDGLPITSATLCEFNGQDKYYIVNGYYVHEDYVMPVK